MESQQTTVILDASPNYRSIYLQVVYRTYNLANLQLNVISLGGVIRFEGTRFYLVPIKEGTMNRFRFDWPPIQKTPQLPVEIEVRQPWTPRPLLRG